MTSKISKLATIVNPITKFKIISNNPGYRASKPVIKQAAIGNSGSG
jgi:hypothetical protein